LLTLITVIFNIVYCEKEKDCSYPLPNLQQPTTSTYPPRLISTPVLTTTTAQRERDPVERGITAGEKRVKGREGFRRREGGRRKKIQ
jgi:hypothetical protein